MGGEEAGVIRVQCRTNLDRFKGERWPEAMVAVPRKGEMVQSESGKALCVVEVTHAVYGERTMERALHGQPYVKVDLHAPPGLEATYMRDER